MNGGELFLRFFPELPLLPTSSQFVLFTGDSLGFKDLLDFSF